MDYEKDYSIRRPFMGFLYRSQIGGINQAERKSSGDFLNGEDETSKLARKDFDRVSGQSSENETFEIWDTNGEHGHKVTTVKPEVVDKEDKEYTLELNQSKDNENYSIPNREISDPVVPSVKKGYLVYSEACQIPDVDPYHSTVRKLIATSAPLDCSRDYPRLTYAQGNIFRINESSIDFWKAKHNLTANTGHLVCCYHEVYRANDGQSDNSVGITKNCTPIADGEEVATEFILVRCAIFGSEVIYKNYHSFVHDKPKTEERCQNTDNTTKEFDHYNVVIIGADAMSRLNMHRQLKKTFKYLTETMGGIEMNGFNKVGDNTFPNLIPLLMGVHDSELPEVCRNTSDPMDDCELIWERFAKAGYRTFYAEDTPHISTFNYIKPGFLSQPTDYYYRTMIHPYEDDLGRDHRGNCDLCVGSMAEAEACLDYAGRFISNFGQRKYFAMSWINSMSHDYLNSASAGDHFFANFFESLDQKSHLDNTFVIMMGDHGLRWGEIRETHIGRLEERLPMLIVVPPKNFATKYPELYKNLRANANRLVTPFDLYATIQNVLRFQGVATTVSPYSVDDQPHTRTIRENLVKRAVSLFAPVPVNRSCEDASIVEAWCTCHQSEPVDVNDKEVVHVGEFLTSKVNQMFAKHPECAKLKLHRVVKASLRTPKNKLNAEGRPSSNIFDYTVEVVTLPGEAKLEGTVRFVPYKHEHALLGDVSRLNLYGNQSSCVQDAFLRKYCYCVETS